MSIMQKNLTCTVCPMGCRLEISWEDGKITALRGNSCPRGERYAREECTLPRRTLTGTVRLEGGGWLPVRSDRPLPRNRIAEGMALLRTLCLRPPVRMDDRLCASFLENGVNLIACADCGEENRVSK